MTRVLVLGGGGMLGSMVARVLGAQADLDVVATQRETFDARRDDVAALLDAVRPAVVVNAIGVLSSRIDAADETAIKEAIEVNARFPRRLADAASQGDVLVVHATTDGVFSGRDGPYDERARHDARDVYGKTKSRGEVGAEHVLNLRCSIVGPEPRKATRSLLAWLLAQPRGARLTGYDDQRWNGITTLHFARLCGAIVRSDAPPSGFVHVVPADVVTKAELLALLAHAYGREDLEIVPGPSGNPTDRSLATCDPDGNAARWRAAGYDRPPTIGEMVTELARGRM